MSGQSFRTFAWKKARRELLPRLPLEVIKRRVKRAAELGLAYPQYASILLGTGRDIVAFLFTQDSLGLRLERSLPLPDHVATKLDQIDRCDRLLMTGDNADPVALAQVLASASRIRFAGVGQGPASPSLTAGRAAIRRILDPLKLPGDSVVMVGTRAQERDWADAAKLAQFMAADTYFDAR